MAVLLDRYHDVANPPANFLEDVANDFKRRGLREKAIGFYRWALEVDPGLASSSKALSELTE